MNQSVVAGMPTLPPADRPFRVLIIEDNLLNLEMACDLLQSAGFITDSAEDALTGIALARQALPDVILIDLHLPNMDGFEATRQLKQDPLVRHIPVVAFTALVMKGDREKALAAGCQGYISKPIDIRQFAATVASFAQQGRASAPAASAAAHAPPMTPSPPPASFTPVWSPVLPPAERPAPPPPLPTPAAPTLSRPPEVGLRPSVGVPPGSQRTHRILVVDDNLLNLELIRETLLQGGHEVLAASGGEEALTVVHQGPPLDLMLLDIMMPGVDGYMVLQDLKSHPETADLPVILISALDKTTDIVQGFRLGAYDYIPKPFRSEEVRARVAAALHVKDLQDALKAERDRWNRVFRHSGDGMVVLDDGLRVRLANPVFSEWFELTVDEQGALLGTPLAFSDLVAPSNAAADGRNGASGSPGADWVRQTGVLRPVTVSRGGQTRTLQVHSAPMPSLTNEPPGYLLIIRDITAQTALEERKETFVATLTHDLKTPIRAEARAIELLMGGRFGPVSEPQREVLTEVQQSNRFMQRMVDNLLDTYRYEDGQKQLQREPLELNGLIRQVSGSDVALLAEAHGVNIVLHLDPDSPRLLADPLEIQRVLHNLLTNAIAHSPEGGTVCVGTQGPQQADQATSPPEVVCWVSDSGRGIEPELQASLFTRYGGVSKRFRQVGTGLGLYLSRQIVEAHGGRIGLTSAPGQGSRFWFTLPVPIAPVLAD